MEEENNIKKRIEEAVSQTESFEEWASKNKPEEIKNVFNGLNKINGFQIIKSNLRPGRFSNEPSDGTISYNGEVYYFKFSHEFDEGNTYIVYKNNNPVFYFSLYNDSEGDINSPLVFESN